jgi:hypothetical protein
MASEMSEYLADLVLNALCHGVDITVPTELTVKIFETLPARDGTGGVEADYDDYAAQTVPCGASSEWAAPSTSGGRRVTSNESAIEFPESSASSTHNAAGFGVYDGANLLFTDANAFAIPPSFQPIIDIGGLVFGFKAAAAASYALQDRVLNAIFRNTAFSALTGIEVEHYETLPDKEDAGGVEASFTGYASETLDCGDVTTDWDTPGDSGSLRMVSNTDEFDCGTANEDSAADLEGIVIRDQSAVLLAIVAHLTTQTIATGTKLTHKANSIRIRF